MFSHMSETPAIRPAAVGAAARRLAHQHGRLDEAHRILDEARPATGVEHPGLLVVRAELLLLEARVPEARNAAETARAGVPELRNARVRASVARAAEAALARVESAEAEGHLVAGARDQALFALRRAAVLDPAWPDPRQRLDELRPRRPR
jgi:hypothetical protein